MSPELIALAVWIGVALLRLIWLSTALRAEDRDLALYGAEWLIWFIFSLFWPVELLLRALTSDRPSARHPR